LVRVFAIQKSKLGPSDPVTMRTMRHLAGAYLGAGQLTNSLAMCEEGFKLSSPDIS
jgi:hypothetical protein